MNKKFVYQVGNNKNVISRLLLIDWYLGILYPVHCTQK